MKKLCVFFALFLAIAGPAFGYSVSREVFASAGGTCSSAAYTTYVSMGDGLVSIEATTTIITPESNPPTIRNILFDGISIINNDYVAPTPTITATITDDSSGVDATRSAIELDSSFIYLNNLPAGSSYTNGSLTYKPTLGTGPHTIKFIAYDILGNLATTEAVTFRVDSGAPALQSPVLNWPNPFNPAAGQVTEINYILNVNAEITIYIYNLIGQPIKKINCPAGSVGGQAGYNRVRWNGESDFNEVVPNDVYIARVILGGKQVGKCKIAVLK